MKLKLLIYFIPVILSAFLLYGYGINDNPHTDLLSIDGIQKGETFAIGDSCNGPGSIQYDDGSFENGYGWNPVVTDGRFVSKFTPLSYPWQFTKLCVAFTRTAAGIATFNFDIVVYDTTGAGGTPGAVVATIPGQSITGILIYPAYSWYNFDMSSIPVLSNGSYYIGLKWDPAAAGQNNKYIMADQSSAGIHPGYYWTNAGPWGTIQSIFPDYKKLGMRTEGEAPTPSIGNTLVIYNDSTASTTQRTADRDTLRKYVNIMIGNVTYMTKNTATVFPDLSSYNTIIFQETSFDAVAVRDLTPPQRTAIKTWLASGTPSSKKSLILIGADMGYSYSRAGSAAQDLEWSETYGGYQYINDNAAPTGFNRVGQSPPGTHFDDMSTTPPGGSYWPDGCRAVNGGVVHSRYFGRSTGDTLAGISKTSANWNVITTFQDPRYYTGAGDDDGSGYRGFNRVLFNMVKWVLENQGIITNVNPGIVSTIADRYELSQNYPNPFNPATTINFSIPKSGLVTLKIYDMLGKEVATLINESRNAGNYTVEFNAAALSSGTYFYRIESGTFTDIKKMMLIK